MMKRYEKYKPSGVEWIGEIPSHWYLKRTKWVFNESKSRNRDLTFVDKDLLSVSEYYGVGRRVEKIDSDDILNRAESLSEYKIVELGYLVINIMLAWKKGLGVSAYQGIVSPSYCVFTPSIKNINPKYFHYLYRTDMYAELFRQNSTGIIDSRLRLYPEEFFNTVTILPPLAEQTTIANYFDEKTVQIDTLVANKQKLIELLKEERIAIINHAVTKGVNPKAKLKPSGIEWLGDIPEHWEVKKLKYVVSKVGSGITPTGGASVYQNQGIPLLRSQNIYNDGLKLDDVAYISENIDEQMSNSRIEEDDVLLNITGASIGRCFYIPKGFGKGNVNQHVCIIRPIQKLLGTRFLHSIIISGYGQVLIDTCQTGANREGLNFQQIKAFDLPVPDIKEQEQIVDFIDARSTRIDATISKIEKEIKLLQEYRTALISEVVTGKIKVI